MLVPRDVTVNAALQNRCCRIKKKTNKAENFSEKGRQRVSPHLDHEANQRRYATFNNKNRAMLPWKKYTKCLFTAHYTD